MLHQIRNRREVVLQLKQFLKYDLISSPCSLKIANCPGLVFPDFRSQASRLVRTPQAASRGPQLRERLRGVLRRPLGGEPVFILADTKLTDAVVSEETH